MQHAQGSHLIGKEVAKIPRETPTTTRDQTALGVPVEVLPQDIEDLSFKQLNDASTGPNTKTYGVAGDLWEDSRKSGPMVYGGRDDIKGKGILGPGLENFPKEAMGYNVPGPRPSYEVVRRTKLKPKLDPNDFCDCCEDDGYQLKAKEFIAGLVKSHQKGYKRTERGDHGADYAINNATFRDPNKAPGQYIDPNQSANEYKYGYQRSVQDDAFGVPVMNLDGISRVSLKSAEVVPQKATRARGSRDGGRSIAGKNRVGFK